VLGNHLLRCNTSAEIEKASDKLNFIKREKRRREEKR
jgi:hypothetical protein